MISNTNERMNEDLVHLSGSHSGTIAKEEDNMFLDSIVAENGTSDIFVQKGLARILSLHFMKNYHIELRNDAPLVLAITGAFGVGKSVSVEEICKRLGIKVVQLGNSHFESMWEGEPTGKINEEYIKASNAQSEKGIPHCLMIDDIDLAIGNFKEFSSGTKNTQRVIKAIMAIADNPYNVGNHSTDRVPIIMTSNDLSKLYGALCRPKRMRAWSYELDRKEIFSIVKHIFKYLLSSEQIMRLETLTRTWTLAHFGQLKSIVQELVLEQQCKHISARDYIYGALKNEEFSVQSNINVTTEILATAIDEVENSELAAKKNYAKC